MKPLYLKSLMLVACSLVSLADTKAYDLARETSLANWLDKNNLLVETQFRLLELPFEVDYNSEVAHYIERYLRPGRRETERLMGRAAYYFPIFEEALKKQGLPGWLKYLPIVESGLHAGVESPVGAVGLWQFMPATAAFFDLRVEERIDERMDPHRSSQAAAKLLRHLYEEFGDWSLALAAYNCGPARVKKAIRQEGVAGYEAIKKRLPGQTQRYIIKLKAAAYVANYYYLFGLKAVADTHLNGEITTLPIRESMSFEAIANRVGISVKKLNVLNPAYLSGTFFAGESRVPIRLPAAAAEHWEKTEQHDRRAQKQGPDIAQTRQDRLPAPHYQEYRKPLKTSHVPPFKMIGTLPQPERLPVKEKYKKSVLVRLQRQELRNT